MTATDTDNASGDRPKSFYGRVEDSRLTADDMDARRKENIAYEYLCHLEEAKVWIEACVNEVLPETTELEEGLRNGVVLAKLAHFMNPDTVPLKRIYDRDEARYQSRGLHFRHTDNINHWLRAMQEISLPKIFYPETTDIYDRKNMPRTIYCLHALSLFLFKLGKAPQIQDLYGKIKFTDAEISAMRAELDKYGIQMPAFSKIGGILANEMPVDEAALHAAIIAINDAIDHQVSSKTVAQLQNAAAHLVNIYEDLDAAYQSTMYEAKSTKSENTRNKSMDPDSSYIPDVYDELLTQAELQGFINKINCDYALGLVSTAVKKSNTDKLSKCFSMPHLSLRDVKTSNSTFYMQRARQLHVSRKSNNNSGEDVQLSKDDVQLIVRHGNQDAEEEQLKCNAVASVNSSLDGASADATLAALENSKALFPPVAHFAAILYHEEFKNIRQEKQASLDHEEIVGGIQVLTAIAQINKAVETGNAGLTFAALSISDAHILGLDHGCQDKYHTSLAEFYQAKSKETYNMLSHFDIQSSVNDVNQQVNDENNRILAVGVINEAVDKNSPKSTLSALQHPTAALSGVEDNNCQHYQTLLHRCKKEKARETGDPACVLWYEEIQGTVQLANKHRDTAVRMSSCLHEANQALSSGNLETLVESLCSSDMALHSITPECGTTYLQKLCLLRQSKMSAGESGSGWMMNRTKEGYKFYFNIVSEDWSWERPDGVKKDHSVLSREEIQSCVTDVTSAYDRQLLFKSNERMIVNIQARIRGYIARKRCKERLAFMQTQLPAILRVQCWWKMVRARRSYLARLMYLHSATGHIITLQSYLRMFLVRRDYCKRLTYLNQNEAAAVKIQTFLRSKWAKNDYKSLMYGETPPLSVVRKFVHLLDIGESDYTEEIELEKLRQQVMSDIRTNNKLETDLNQMDIKIGLLVKNRITLQDVMTQHRSLKQYRQGSTSSLGNHSRGLKALSKSSRQRLEAYQHLFYLLQTSPSYLARLIFAMPQSKTSKFMESVILTLYNYASNQREEYLLLRLFKTALQEEISSKVEKLGDIVTGNPMVVKMIVSFNRNARGGQSSLRELLNPLVTEVLEDRSMAINTNPVEVYKQWINMKESVSGKASGMAYDVSIEQALAVDEVRERIDASVLTLQRATDKFLTSILSSIDKIPYSMRYMAKVLRNALHEKFPEAAEKDILKIVGNLIYYRYINSTIVAPDAFDIVDISSYKGLTNDQRRNLGSIAKILQFAASNKGFGGDSAHLSSLNPYIMEAHNKFKKYFRAVCEVDEPEQHFNVDQYSDVTRVTKPVIYVTVAEIIETHKMLLEHEDTIAPDQMDPLHELLEDLGDGPDIESLMGDGGEDDSEPSRHQLGKTEISLTLSNKFAVGEDDASDARTLLLCTKRMVVDVIRCQSSGDTLLAVLETPARETDEDQHQALIRTRDRAEQRAANRTSKLVRQQSLLGDTRLPLQHMKVKIQANLVQLEHLGLVSRHNHYQAVLTSLVADIRSQRQYRQRRRLETVSIRHALKSLSQKRTFYIDQIDYYNQYVKTCLDNLAAKNKKSGKKAINGAKAKGSIKYSAAKLFDKGVILEIEGLPWNQFKNVLFEISATPSPGLFEVSAKFMGVNMEKVDLVFQDLLQLQYEGVAVMKMFDKAKVNVNLLIFLLNKKFYGK